MQALHINGNDLSFDEVRQVVYERRAVLLSPDALAQVRRAFAAQGPQGLTLFNQVIVAMKASLVQGLHEVFILNTLILSIGLVALFFLKEIELRGGRASTERVAAGAEEAVPTMVH